MYYLFFVIWFFNLPTTNAFESFCYENREKSFYLYYEKDKKNEVLGFFKASEKKWDFKGSFNPKKGVLEVIYQDKEMDTWTITGEEISNEENQTLKNIPCL